MWLFKWIREQVKAAVVGGFADAATTLGVTDEQVIEKLTATPMAPPALPEAEQADTTKPAKRTAK